jgi:hypothetical protein
MNTTPFKRKRDAVDEPRFNTIKYCTTGLSAYQSIKQRTVRGNIVFGRKVSGKDLYQEAQTQLFTLIKCLLNLFLSVS